MKTYRLLFLVAILGILPVTFTACATSPTTQLHAIQTLKVTGQTAKTSMDAATQLLKQHSITVAQWQKVADFYDGKFQPAFNVAVLAAHSDLSSVTSPDVALLAAEFIGLVAQLSTHP